MILHFVVVEPIWKQKKREMKLRKRAESRKRMK